MSTVIKGRAGAGGFPRGWKDRQVGIAKENITKNKAIAAIPTLDWGGDIVGYLDIPNAPTGAIWTITCTTGEYIAVGYDSPPFVKVYRRSGSSFTEISISVTPSKGSCAKSFSADGTYLALGDDNPPYVYIYKRSGDTYNKLSTPNIQLDAWVASLALSPDGVYLAVQKLFSDDTKVRVYKRSGDIFSEIASLEVNFNAAISIKFSPDGNYLAFGVLDSTALYIYKRSGDIFSDITANINEKPHGSVNGLCFSPDGIYLALAENVTGQFEIYKRSGGTFIKTSIPTPMTLEIEYDVSFSPDGNYVAIGGLKPPYTHIYKRNGDEFIYLNTPQIAEARVNAICFSSDGNYLYVGQEEKPYLIVCDIKSYNVYNAMQYIKLGNWESDAKLGIALENAQTDAKLKINLFPAVNISNP